MLCVTQFSAAGGAAADMSPQATVAEVQASDATGNVGSPVTQLHVTDLSPELSEPMLPVPIAMSPGVGAVRPVEHVAVALPHPLIEGPQRPPRAFRT